MYKPILGLQLRSHRVYLMILASLSIIEEEIFSGNMGKPTNIDIRRKY